MKQPWELPLEQLINGRPKSAGEIRLDAPLEQLVPDPLDKLPRNRRAIGQQRRRRRERREKATHGFIL